MEALWSYDLQDFLLFSPRAYWRLFELHNEVLWPLQILPLTGFLLGAALAGSGRATMRKLAWVLVSLVWLWVGSSFVLGTYAAINWAAVYLAGIWAAGAFLYMTSFCVRSTQGETRRAPRLLGWGLIGYATLLHPLWPLATNRPLAQAEIVGTAPDPTAIATLGLVLLTNGGGRAVLAITPPMAWCIVSAATLLTMGALQGWAMLAAAIIAGVALMRQTG